MARKKNTKLKAALDMKHRCSSNTCKILNPSLTELLGYEELVKRITKVDKSYFAAMGNFDFKRLEKYPSFFDWCELHNVFQLVNREFIHALAGTIERINPEVIVEVGAGHGLLSKHLSEALGREVIATDDNSWDYEIPSNTVKLDCKDALKTYNPDLVIAAWIPYGKYWTGFFRKHPSVKGYILIGEGWGGGATGSIKDFYKNGWERTQLDEVEAYSICRTDHYFFGHTVRHSHIVYFKRPEEGLIR